MRLRIALRNVFRNATRTALSVLMIAGAAAGIILFHGFSEYLLARMQKNAIDNRYSHIQVATQAFWDMAPGNRKGQLISDYSKLADKISAIPGVTTVSGRMSFYGLLSTGDDTISAEGMGYDPAKETQFQKNLVILDGRALDPGSKSETMVGRGLQRRLSLHVGQSVTALSYSLDGVVNAIDLTVVGVFQIGLEEVDAHVFMLPIASVQTLLDTTSVEKVVVRLKNNESLNAILPVVAAEAKQIDPHYQAKSWYQLADFFRQSESFFKTQNRVIEAILISLILSGIMNTVGMTVYERTGEIGTIRALGEPRRSILLQFTLEGAILGAIGVGVGCLFGTLVSYGISALHFSMVLPGASYPVPIRISLVPSAYVEAAAVGLFSAIGATWLPAIRASKIAIVEALKKNL